MALLNDNSQWVTSIPALMKPITAFSTKPHCPWACQVPNWGSVYWQLHLSSHPLSPRPRPHFTLNLPFPYLTFLCHLAPEEQYSSVSFSLHPFLSSTVFPSKKKIETEIKRAEREKRKEGRGKEGRRDPRNDRFLWSWVLRASLGITVPDDGLDYCCCFTGMPTVHIRMKIVLVRKQPCWKHSLVYRKCYVSTKILTQLSEAILHDLKYTTNSITLSSNLGYSIIP